MSSVPNYHQLSVCVAIKYRPTRRPKAYKTRVVQSGAGNEERTLPGWLNHATPQR